MLYYVNLTNFKPILLFLMRLVVSVYERDANPI